MRSFWTIKALPIATSDCSSTAVPELADASQQLLRETARWLRDLYPPPATQPVASHREEPPWFRPLTPELLGEALLARVLATAPALPARLLNHATEVQATRTFAVLTQAARTHTSATNALRTALTDHLPRLWRSAGRVPPTGGKRKRA